MTNYEAILKHPKEFLEYLMENALGGADTPKGQLAEIIARSMTCKTCPYNWLINRDGVCSNPQVCSSVYKKVLDEEYRGADDERHD